MESISSASRKQAAGLDEISIAIHMVHDLTLSSSEQAPRAAEVTAKLDEGVQACRKSITIAMEYPAHPNELGPDEKTKGMTSTVTNAYIEFDDVA
jgi:hypothetical protein